MFTGDEIVATLRDAGVTQVVWVPDSTTGLWEQSLVASSQIQLLRVCREGEAWPLAGGLFMGGQFPIVVMQTTGFYESGDAMRNVLFDLQLPLCAIIGVRNWLIEESTDSARKFARPVLNAWGVDQEWIAGPVDKPKLAKGLERCRSSRKAGIVLLAEGHG